MESIWKISLIIYGVTISKKVLFGRKLLVLPEWSVLNGIEHKEKLEILVNPVCVPDCKRRGEHYRQIAKGCEVWRGQTDGTCC